MAPEETTHPPIVSLCMIVRDEESRLGSCLSAARDAVDEIVIVDTGSRDQTPRLARSFGARVIHHAWSDDYAAARNISLDAALGTFCLYLDADEILRSGSTPILRNAVMDPVLGGGLLRVANDHGSYRTMSTQVRLFRRLAEVRFEGAIHEQIAPTLRAACTPRGLVVRPLDVTLDHDGYHPARLATSDKLAKRCRLLRRHLDREPGDIYMRFKLAELLHEIGDRPAALAEIEDTARRVRAGNVSAADLPCVTDIPALLGLCLHESGRDRDAYTALLPEAEESNSANLHFVLGMVAHRLGDHERAAQAFLRCLELDGEASLNPKREGISSFLARTGLGAVAAARGAMEEARRWLEAALDENPACDAALRLFVELATNGTADLCAVVAERVERFARHPATGPEGVRRAAGWLITLGFAEKARQLAAPAAC